MTSFLQRKQDKLNKKQPLKMKNMTQCVTIFVTEQKLSNEVKDGCLNT